jgi:ATP-binding cassette subfamily D (ALD) protein 3
VTGTVVNSIRKPLAYFASGEQQLEGQFHSMTSRVVTHSEEIAFMNGGSREHRGLVQALDNLLSYIRRMHVFRRAVGVLDQLVAKYVRSSLRLLLLLLRCCCYSLDHITVTLPPPPLT